MFVCLLTSLFFYLGHLETCTGIYPENFVKIPLDLAEILRIRKLEWKMFICLFVCLCVCVCLRVGRSYTQFNLTYPIYIYSMISALHVSDDYFWKKKAKGKRTSKICQLTTNNYVITYDNYTRNYFWIRIFPCFFTYSSLGSEINI